VADFSGGHLSNDGGALLLRMVDNSLGMSRMVASCFEDRRDQRFTEHSTQHLIAQRIFGRALGYEDLNDHHDLRRDPLFAAAVGKTDPLGGDRLRGKDRGRALAGASSLNRLELGNRKFTRAHKIRCNSEKLERCLLKLGVNCLDRHSRERILDFDATDDPLHGKQEGRHFHGYYGNYCYLPLYGFIGDVPVWAQLRTCDRDGADGTVEALEKIVPVLRRPCPKARIILRADGGFCREGIMKWCEENGVKYVLGLARNARLEAMIQENMVQARIRQCLCGVAVRVFGDHEYRTVKSWSRLRRVVSKSEVTLQGDNPRFIVTNWEAEEDGGRFESETLYEKVYCGRGQMENVIKQPQLDLQADRTSTGYLESNQLRLWFSTWGYLLLDRLRAWGLAGSSWAKATVGTVRLKRLKIAAQVAVSVRRIYIQMSSAYPLQKLWRDCRNRLQALSCEPIG
jgi:hypothetical protein